MLHPKVSVLLVGIRLIPGHRAKIRQHPFNGIPHGVEFRVLERVGEIQVHRNIAASNIQRPIRVTEARTYSEAGPRVAVRLATGRIAIHVDEIGSCCGIFVQTIPEAAPQRDITADLPQFVQGSAVRDFPRCPTVDLLVFTGFEHSGAAECAGWAVEYFAVGQTENPVNLLVFSDNHDAPNRVQKSTNFGKLHPGTPSLAEITYEAFQIPTIEYCMELFGSLCIYESTMNTRNGSKDSLKIDSIDDILKSSSFKLPKEYIICKKRFDSRAHKKSGWKNPITNEILPLYVRNINDHPESISEKAQAIDYFTKHNNKYLGGDPVPPEALSELEKIDNTYTEEDLEKAIEILLWAIPRCQELIQEEYWTWDFKAKDLIKN